MDMRSLVGAVVDALESGSLAAAGSSDGKNPNRWIMRYEYISWDAFYRLCGELYRRILAARFEPEQIIAITRGGYPVARVLSDYFGIIDLATLKIEHYHGPTKMPQAVVRYPLTAEVNGRRVLLVDDVSDSGDTFGVALQHIHACGEPAAIRSAVLHHKVVSRFRPDFFAHRVLRWRWITYPWALVEDLVVIAAGRSPPPASPDELERYLRVEMQLKLPQRVFRQIAPIVLRQLHVEQD